MSPPIGAIVLDTSAVLHIIRGKETGQQIEKASDIWNRSARPLIAIVSHGEARAFAMYRKWEGDKLRALKGLLGFSVVVDIRNEAVLDQFAQLHGYTVSKGIKLSDNDIWIAAVTIAADATLVTTDGDFLPLHQAGLMKLLHIPTGKTSP